MSHLPFRFACIVLASMNVASIRFATPASAQVPPVTVRDATIVLPDPAVEQWLQRAGRSPKDFGQAVSALTRIGEFQRVDELLGSLLQRGYNDQQKTIVASQISSEQRLRIVNHPEISPQSAGVVDELFKLLNQTITSPDRLNQAIAALTDPDADRVLPAIRTLFAGGEASTAALVNAIVATEDASQRDTYLRAMIRIDEQAGIRALRRVALYGTPATRKGALIALVRLSPRDLTEGGETFITIITALHRRDQLAANQTIANQTIGEQDSAAEVARDAILARGDRLPSRTAVIALLRERLAQSQRIASNGLRDFGRTAAWTLNAERDGVEPQRLPGWVLAFHAAADDAARLVAVGDNEPSRLPRQLNAIIASHLVNDPDWGDAKQTEAFYENHVRPALAVDATLSETDFLLDAVALASDSQNEPAMIGWFRMIPFPATRIAPPYLHGMGNEVSPLVRAVDHPNAKVRYEAAAAIGRLAPGQPYAGSNRVLDRFQQMSVLDDLATAIVLENRPEVVSELETLISQAGMQPRFVSSVAELEEVAAVGDDLRLILSKREPMDASAIEMIDVVRRIRVARDCPMVIYSDPPPRSLDSRELEEAIEANQKYEANEATVGLNPGEQQALDDEAAIQPDALGVIGGIEKLQYSNHTPIVEKDLLYGDTDVDLTTRKQFDLQTIGRIRWADESLRAGIINEMVRPRSVAGLYEILLESRRRQHVPPLSPIDRRVYREIGRENATP